LEKKVSFAPESTLWSTGIAYHSCHHYNFEDVRPFYFHTYGQESEYTVAVRYTSVVDLSDITSGLVEYGRQHTLRNSQGGEAG